MSVKRELIKGTLILAAAGFAARLLGFFNRVYLANLISNAELGRYQLIFPIVGFVWRSAARGYRWPGRKWWRLITAQARKRQTDRQ